MTSITGNAFEFITFSRTSNATVTDSDGLIKWAPHNLLLASEQFDSASWTKLNVTIGANAIAAPNGTSTADKTVETIANALHCPYNNSITGQANTSYTLSVFAKAAERNWITLILGDGFPATNLARASFNLTTGAVGTVGTAATAYPPVDVGNGWWLCRISATSVGTTFGAYFCNASADDTFSYAGDITKGLYLWGASFYRSDLGGMKANTSAYPMYNPTTPKNLLGFTESLTTGWTNTNTTDAIASEVSPVGLTGAVDVAATAGNGTLLGSVSLLASPYTFSIWLKRKTGAGAVEITVDGTTYVTAAVTGTWTRFSTTLTPSAGTKTPGIRLVTSGDAVYAWGAQLSDSASLDTYVPNYGPAPTAAAYYGPRLDYDPVTLAAKGLLVEEQRTNRIRYSRTLETTSSYWTNVASGTANTVTIDNAPGPDGLSTSASLLTFNTAVTGAGTYSLWRHSLTTTANGTWTFTVWLKAGTTSSVYLRFGDNAGNRANTLCTLTSSWQRFTVTGTTTASITSISCDIGADGNAGGQTMTAGTVYAWGAQLELGGFATSYIPNGDAIAGATRDADVASVSTQAFPYDQTKGTLVAYATTFATGGDRAIVALSGAGVNHWTQFYSGGANGNFNVTTGGAVTTTPLVAGTIKVAGAFADNDMAVSRDAQAAVPDNTVTVTGGVTSMTVGSLSGSNYLNGHIRQITYLPRRISNAELQTRTA